MVIQYLRGQEEGGGVSRMSMLGHVKGQKFYNCGGGQNWVNFFHVVIDWPIKEHFFSSIYEGILFLVPTGSDMKCVLKSQMIPLLAHDLSFCG